MPMMAPTPWPFAFSFAYSIGRSSAFSKLNLSFSPPMPSGTFTFADQCRSSCTSKPFDPGKQLRDLGRVHEDVPDHLRRRIELLHSFDLHALTTSTRALLSSGFVINRHTRSAGLWLSETTPGIPALRSAS